MAGIIKGHLLDDSGRRVNPGKPVTLKAVRSDGLPDVAITTANDGSWSFNINAEAVGEVDFDFVYNGVNCGSHKVRFIDTVQLSVLPYSSNRLAVDTGGLLAVGVADENGKGIPNIPVSIHIGGLENPAEAVVVTDRFGIAEWEVPAGDQPRSRYYHFKAGKDTTSTKITWAEDNATVVSEIKDWDAMWEIDTNGYGVFTGLLWSADDDYFYDFNAPTIFSKELLRTVTTEEVTVGDGFFLKATETLPAGSNTLVFCTGGAKVEIDVLVDDYGIDGYADLVPKLPGARYYPTGVTSIVKFNVANGEFMWNYHSYAEVTVEENGSVKKLPIYPDATVKLAVSGSRGHIETHVFKDQDGVKVGEQVVEFIIPSELAFQEYSVTRMPLGYNGTVGVAVKDADGNGIPHAVVNFTVFDETYRTITTLEEVTDKYGLANGPAQLGFNARPGNCRVNCSFGMKQVNHDVAFVETIEPIPHEVVNLNMPSVGTTTEAMTISGKVVNFAGSGEQTDAFGIYDKNTLTWTPVPAGTVQQDGTFTIDHGPLTEGDHDLILGLEGGFVERDTTWSVGIPQFANIVLAPYSTQYAAVGESATYAFFCYKSEADNLETPVADIPVTFTLDFGSKGTYIDNATTNANGIVEFSVPAEFKGWMINGSFTATADGGHHQRVITTQWIDSRPVVSVANNVQVMNPVQIGQRCYVDYTPMTNEGGKSSWKLGVYDLNEQAIVTGVSQTSLLDGRQRISFPAQEAGVSDFVFYMENWQQKSSITWQETVEQTPTGIQIDSLAPTAGLINTNIIVRGKVTGQDGLPLRPNRDLFIKLVEENGDSTPIQVGPGGEWEFMAMENAEGPKAYRLDFVDTELYTHTITFYDNVSLQVPAWISDNMSRMSDATAVVLVKDVNGNGIPGMLIDFVSADQEGPAKYGTALSDQYGISQVQFQFGVEGTDTPSVVESDVKMIIRDTSIAVSHNMTWQVNSYNAGTFLSSLTVTSPTFEGEKATVTGRIHGAVSDTLSPTQMWLTTFNKETLESVIHDVSSFNSDGSFSVEVGPFPLGSNPLVVATNGYHETEELVYEEAPVVIHELRKLPYTAAKARVSNTATLAFAAVNNQSKGMEGIEVQLHLGDADGEILETKVTDKYGIVEFQVPGSKNGVDNSGNVTYLATVGENWMSQAVVLWSPWTSDCDYIHEFEITEEIRDGVQGVAKFGTYYWSVSKQMYIYGSTGVMGVFDKASLTTIHAAAPSLRDIRWRLVYFDALAAGTHDLIVYTSNAHKDVTVTWGSFEEVLPVTMEISDQSGEAFLTKYDGFVTGKAMSATNVPIKTTGPLVGKVFDQTTPANKFDVLIAPDGTFGYIVNETVAGYYNYELTIGENSVGYHTLRWESTYGISSTGINVTEPKVGTDAVVAFKVTDVNAVGVPNAIVAYYNTDRDGPLVTQYVKTDAVGVAVVNVPYDAEYPAYQLTGMCNRKGTARALAWVNPPNLTSDSIIDLVVPESTEAGAKAVVTGKVLDQNGDAFDESILWVHNRDTGEFQMYPGGSKADGTFSLQVGPFPIGANDIAVVAPGCLIDTTVSWASANIIDHIVVDGPEIGQGVENQAFEMRGTAITTDGVAFIPAEGYELTITTDVSAFTYTATFDAMGSWTASVLHPSAELVTLTFKTPEDKVVGTYQVNYAVDPGFPTGLDMEGSVSVGKVGVPAALTGKVRNNKGGYYTPLEDTAIQIVKGEETVEGVIHPTGEFEVTLSNETAETVNYSFQFGGSEFDTRDVKWCTDVILTVDAISQPKGALNDDATMIVSLKDDTGAAIDGAGLQLYAGEVAGDAMYTDEWYGSTLLEAWLDTPTSAGVITYTAKVDGFTTTTDVEWIGDTPKFAAGFHYPTTRQGYVVNKKASSDATATFRTIVVDQDGTPRPGPQPVSILNVTTGERTDHSADVGADGVLELELAKPGADGNHQFFVGTEGETLNLEINWSASNPDCKRLVLGEGVSADIDKTSSNVTLAGKCLDSSGAQMAPGTNIDGYCNGSDDYTANFRLNSAGDWSLTRPFNTEGEITLSFFSNDNKTYLGDIVVNVLAEPRYSEIAIISAPEKATVGEKAPITVETRDQFGNPMGRQSVVWSDGGIPNPAWPSDDNGRITFDMTHDTAESVTYMFQGHGGPSTDVVVVWEAVTPVYTDIELVSGATTGTTGETINVVVRTIDQFGNPFPEGAVNLQYGSNPPSPIWRSDENGLIDWNISSEEAGEVIYRFRGAAGDGYDHTVTWTEPAPALPTISVNEGEPTTGQATVAVWLDGKVTNPDGSPVPNASINYYRDGVKLGNFRAQQNGNWSKAVKAEAAGEVTFKFGDEEWYVPAIHVMTFDPAPPALGSIVFDANAPTTGEIGKYLTITGRCLDENGDPIEQRSIQYSINGVVKEPVNSAADGTFTISPGSTVAGDVVYRLYVGSVEATHTVTWAEPAPAFNTIELSPKNPTDMEVGNSGQINGTCRDPEGNLLDRNHDIPYFINGVETGTVSPLREGIFTLPISGPAEGGDVVYRFGDNVNYQQVEHTVTWTVPPKNTIVVDANVPTTGEVGATITITGEVQDKWGDNMNYERLPWYIDGVEQAEELNTEQAGGWTVDVSAATAGEVVYTFGNPETQIQDTHTVTWEEPVAIKEIVKLPYSATEGQSNGSVRLAFKVTDVNDAPVVGKSVELVQDTITGTLVGAVDTDKYGIATFNILGNDATTSINYYAKIDGKNRAATVAWKTTSLPFVIGLTGPDTIDMASKATFTGMILDQTAQPIALETLNVYNRTAGTNQPFALTLGNDGSFSIDVDIEVEGTNDLTVSTPAGYVEHTITGTKEAPVFTRVDFTGNVTTAVEDSRVELRGKVLDQYGEPFLSEVKLAYYMNGTFNGHKYTDNGGVLIVPVSDVLGEVTYELKDNNTSAVVGSWKVEWRAAPVASLINFDEAPDTAVPGTTVTLAGDVFDQYGEPFLGEQRLRLHINGAYRVHKDCNNGRWSYPVDSDDVAVVTYTVEDNNTDEEIGRHVIDWKTPPVPTTAVFEGHTPTTWLEGTQLDLKADILDQYGDLVVGETDINVYINDTLNSMSHATDGKFHRKQPAATGTVKYGLKYGDVLLGEWTVEWRSAPVLTSVTFEDTPETALPNTAVTLRGKTFDQYGDPYTGYYNLQLFCDGKIIAWIPANHGDAIVELPATYEGVKVFVVQKTADASSKIGEHTIDYRATPALTSVDLSTSPMAATQGQEITLVGDLLDQYGELWAEDKALQLYHDGEFYGHFNAVAGKVSVPVTLQSVGDVVFSIRKDSSLASKIGEHTVAYRARPAVTKLVWTNVPETAVTGSDVTVTCHVYDQYDELWTKQDSIQCYIDGDFYNHLNFNNGTFNLELPNNKAGEIRYEFKKSSTGPVLSEFTVLWKAAPRLDSIVFEGHTAATALPGARVTLTGKCFDQYGDPYLGSANIQVYNNTAGDFLDHHSVSNGDFSYALDPYSSGAQTFDVRRDSSAGSSVGQWTITYRAAPEATTVTFAEGNSFRAEWDETVTLNGTVLDQYGDTFTGMDYVRMTMPDDHNIFDFETTAGKFVASLVSGQSGVVGDADNIYKFADRYGKLTPVEVTCHFVSPAVETTLEPIGGANQYASKDLPFSAGVKVLDQHGNNMSGISVEVRTPDGGFYTKQTGANGASWQFDPDRFNATDGSETVFTFETSYAPDLSTTITTMWHGVMTLMSIDFSAMPGSVVPGTDVTLSGVPKDQNGQPYGSNDRVKLHVNGDEGTLVDLRNGAFTKNVGELTEGTYVYTVYTIDPVPVLLATYTLGVGIPKLTSVDWTGTPAQAEGGSTIYLNAKALDQFGNPYPKKTTVGLYADGELYSNTTIEGTYRRNMTHDAGTVVYSLRLTDGTNLGEHSVEWREQPKASKVVLDESVPTVITAWERFVFTGKLYDQYDDLYTANQYVDVYADDVKSSSILVVNGIIDSDVPGISTVGNSVFEFRIGATVIGSHAVEVRNPAEFTSFAFDDGLATSADVGERVTLTGKAYDQYGDLFTETMELRLFDGSRWVDQANVTNGIWTIQTPVGVEGAKTYTVRVDSASDALDTHVVTFGVQTIDSAVFDGHTPTEVAHGDSLTVKAQILNQYGVPYTGENVSCRLLIDGQTFTDVLTTDGFWEAEVPQGSGEVNYTLKLGDTVLGQCTVNWETPPVPTTAVFEGYSPATANISAWTDFKAEILDQRGNRVTDVTSLKLYKNGTFFSDYTTTDGFWATSLKDPEGVMVYDLQYKGVSLGTWEVNWVDPDGPKVVSVLASVPTENTVGEELRLSGHVRTPLGSAVTSGTVVVYVDGAEHATVNINGLGEWTTTHTASAEGDVVYTIGTSPDQKPATHTVTWSKEYNTVTVREGTVTEADVDTEVTMYAIAYNPDGGRLANAAVKLYEDGVEVGSVNTNGLGELSWDVTEATAGPVVYGFGDPETFTQATHTITWIGNTPKGSVTIYPTNAKGGKVTTA